MLKKPNNPMVIPKTLKNRNLYAHLKTMGYLGFFDVSIENEGVQMKLPTKLNSKNRCIFLCHLTL